MIVSACEGLLQKIGGVYRVRYSFVTARTGYSPGGLMTTGAALTVHQKGIWPDLELAEFEEKTKDLSSVETIAGTQFQPLWETIRIFHRCG